MDYPELYKQLNQAIVNVDGDIGKDTEAFVQTFLDSLPEDKSQLGDEAKAQLTAYLTAMQETVASAITLSTAIGVTGSLKKAQSAFQDKRVLALSEQAFNERWADDLTLSKRLWNWQSLTQEGVGQMLQQGVKTGESVNKLMYNMQRMLEFDQQKRFVNISNNRNKWTEELSNAAKQLIHDPAATQQWQYTLNKVEKYIDKLATTGTRHASLQLLNEMKRAVEKGRLDLVDKSLNWWLYDKQLYNLKRIARTEMATAGHRAVIDVSIDDPLIIGYQWRLSSSHKIFDICDYYANIDQGLGKGVFRKDSVPRHKAHPHCSCNLIPRSTTVKEAGSANYAEFIEQLNDKQRTQVLPKWVNSALDDGIPLKQLLREDGLGLVRKQDVLEKLVDAKAEKLIAKLEEKANNATSLADLWANPASYQKHIKKRLKDGHINDEADYFSKVKKAVKSARTFSFVDSKLFPSMELVGGNWSVILNHDGLVKTAYQFEASAKSFTDIQKGAGHKVYGQQLTEKHRTAIKRLFK